MLLLPHRMCFSKPSCAWVCHVTEVASLERFSLGTLPKTDLWSLPLSSTLTNSIYRSLNALPSCLHSCLPTNPPSFLPSFHFPSLLPSFLPYLSSPQTANYTRGGIWFLGLAIPSPAMVHGRCSVNTCWTDESTESEIKTVIKIIMLNTCHVSNELSYSSPISSSVQLSLTF